MLLSGTIILIFNIPLNFDKISLVILCYYLLIHSLYLYFTTLLINILSIKLSSSGGFGIIAGCQIACLTVFAIWEKRLFTGQENSLNRDTRILKCNPLSHLVLKFHSSNIDSLNNKINSLGICFDLNYSVILFFIITLIVILFGCLTIKNQNFIVTNKETGGT